MLGEIIKIDPFDLENVSIILANPDTRVTPEMVDFFFFTFT